MPSAALPPIPQYELDAPTHESAISALARPLGAAVAERVWAASCAAAGVTRERPATLAELERVAGLLARERSVAGVCACSLVVRLISYSMLARKMDLDQSNEQVREQLRERLH